MTASELENAVNAVPFRPFEMVTGDGQRFRVPTPDHFSMSPTKRLVTVWRDNGGSSLLDVFLITHLKNYSVRGPSRRKATKR